MLSYLPGFEPDIDTWTSDDWQTPTKEAEKVVSLIQDDELTILDPCAGIGQLVKPIKWVDSRLVTAIELKPGRVKVGQDRCHWVNWIQGDFFSYQFSEQFDLVLANPAFSLRMDFIRRSLELLKSNGRLLYLMPTDFNCGKAMGNTWKRLDCHIHHQYDFQHRIAYLDANGVPQSGRQIYDAVFDIRPGSGGVRTFL
jgi:SAM-dependent methyltransferase